MGFLFLFRLGRFLSVLLFGQLGIQGGYTLPAFLGIHIAAQGKARLFLPLNILQRHGFTTPKEDKEHQPGGNDKQHAAQCLGNPHTAPHQAIGAQTLHKEAPQAVPGGIAQCDLAIVAAAREQPQQQDRHTDKVPQALV